MKKRVFIILLFGFHFILNGQTRVESKTNLPFEHINLVTDRDLYLSGETIWFSANISVGDEQKAISQILFIELFNANQKSIIRKKYRINQGHANGALDIPSEFLSDIYFIRAYTNYNKNFASDNYFYTAVQIVNPRLSLTAISTNTIDDSIVNPNNKPTHDTSSFLIETESWNSGQIKVSINPPKEYISINQGTYSLELRNSRQKQLHFSDFEIGDSPAQIIIPNSIITSSGLFFILIKDAKKNIVKIHAFIERDKEIQSFELKHNKDIFHPREEVKIQLSELSELNLDNIGITVALKGTHLPAIDKLALFINEPILLFSHLKTQFNFQELSTADADIFLQILNSKLNTPEFRKLFYTPTANSLKWIPEIRDVSLSGIVIDKLTQQPLANIPIYLSVFKEFPQIHIYNSLEDGSFLFSLNNYETEKDVFLCPLFEKTDEIELKVNLDFSPDFPELSVIPLTIDSSHINLLEKMWIASQTSTAFKINLKSQDFKISHLPYSFENPQISVVLDDYIETPTLEIVFKELVPSVRIRKRKDIFSLVVFDSDRELFYNDPLILIDNIPVFNVNELMKIPPEVIEKIEIHNSPFILGEHTINGIIMIQTFTDDFGGMIMPKSSTFFEYQTLNQYYKFNSKTYSTDEELYSRAGDFRTVLHWEPFIQNNGNSQLKFYTSDQTGNYEAYIFGTSSSGQTFHSKLFDFEIRD